MQIQLANNRNADLMSVLALWHELMLEWHPEAGDPLRATMRRGHVAESMSSYLKSAQWPQIEYRHAERACRFDTVLRLASGKIDTMHATADFFTRAENGRWFVPVESTVIDGKSVPKSVRLTDEAITLWDVSSVARERALAAARALLESDVESQGIIVALLPCSGEAPQAAAAQPADAWPRSRLAYLEAVVRGIQDEPHQPVYRRRPFGTAVTGWDARLRAYFWPLPALGYVQTSGAVDALAGRARALADVLSGGGAWSGEQGRMAVALAHDIFKWGGVPQDPDTVTPASVQNVFHAALSNDGTATAHMNSGWTKIAAFATAHLEQHNTRHPQAIWGSRVAAAIIGRLDAQLGRDADPASLFPGVGTVPGRGGSRPRALVNRWPSGYRSWSGHVAGGALVREVRDILNRGGYPAMPLPDGGAGPWTTRGVEMVLFMDGY